jgi:hypothetical protein
MYIKRDSHQSIIAVSQLSEGDITEFLPDDSPELQLFLQSLHPRQLQTLAQSDLAMARVLEDVVQLLVEQGTIRFTDLPDAAQVKLLSRIELRGKSNCVNLLDDGDDLKF